MSNPPFFRHTILFVFILVPGFVFSQVNIEKIKAKWSIEKFETDRNTAQAIKAKQDLVGVYLTFENTELVISKRTATCDSMIKKGQYFVSGNSITLGKDKADILLLSDNDLTIKIPGQGILYLKRM